MKKKQLHSFWVPILLAVISTSLLFVLAEYVFHIPSSFLSSSEPPIKDGWTPREMNNSGDITPTIPKEQKVCTMDYSPVCGKDLNTYSNACMAESNETTVLHKGNCVSADIPKEPVVASGTTLPIIDTEKRENTEIFDTGSYQIYESKNFGYSFALPKFAYYQALGARDGANHVMAIGATSTGVEDVNADIVTYFYKAPPSNPPEGSVLLILENGSLYARANSSSPKSEKIMETIKASAK